MNDAPQLSFAQLAAISRVHWLVFVHSLGSLRGQVELASRIVVGCIFALGAVGGGTGLGGAAWFFLSHGQASLLTILLWPVFVFWQVFPLMATAFTENLDSSNLIRFPLNYPSYFLIRLAFGALDPATILGSCWTLGIWIGITVASPKSFLAAGIVLVIFGVFNVVCSRTIFSWLERWLAHRRTREFMGIIFFLGILSLQLITPAMHRYGRGVRYEALRTASQVSPVQRVLPPGLAAEAIAQATRSHFVRSLGYFSLLCAFTLLALILLDLRLRKQYRGENLNAVEISKAHRQTDDSSHRRLGPNGPIASVLEKELRYLLRSGPMLFTLIVPAFMLLVVRNAAGNSFLAQRSEIALPLIGGYSLLLLTNLIYNNFGNDGSGVQLFYAAPVHFWQVIAGKNLSHALILLAELFIGAAALSAMNHPPTLAAIALTAAATFFALPINLAAGNLLSLYFPKRVDYAIFGRQRAAPATVLASFGIQLFVFAILAATWLLSDRLQKPWLVAGIFLPLILASLSGYAVSLRLADELANKRRDILLFELAKG
jgi:ABC-2 type transport system permease protein